MWLIVWTISCTKADNALTLPYYNTADFTPIFVSSPKEVSQQIPHTIAEVELENQDGKEFSTQQLNGKIHVASFMFTQCGGICPRLTSNLQMLDDSLGSNSKLHIISYTVTPWTDTPEVLKAYKANHGITNSNWQFITGSKTAIYQLARESYFAEENIGLTKDSADFLHTEHLILVDETLRIRGIYNGTLQTEIKQLISDTELLLK
jgi:protein SCO1/2